MTNLAAFRTHIDNILATAVDTSTWTTAIKDEALRQSLADYDATIAYEVDFTVTTTGYSQDLSSITSLKDILAVAHPWESDDSIPFVTRSRPWRYVSDQTIIFQTIEPQEDDIIRVRYTKLHTIEDLDSAAATTIPDRHDRLVALKAAAWACTLRRRQITENPAIPPPAANQLRLISAELDHEANRALHQAQTHHNPVWGNVGL